MIEKVEPSNVGTKRFRAIMKDGRIVNFGYKGGSTYIDGESEQVRDAYRARHYAMEKKFIDNLIVSPAVMSYFILWGDSRNILTNIRELNKMWKQKEAKN